MKFLKSKLTIFSTIALVIFSIFFFSFNTVKAAQYYRVNKSATIEIDEWGICQKVTNTSCALDVFVPTNTSLEWSEFRLHKPSCVSLGSCCECSSGDCCSDGCNWDTSSTVCDSTYATDYGCPSGTGCGADVGRRYQRRYCSGTSATCSGTTSWGSYSTYDYCGTTETCSDNDSSCNYTSSCDVPPDPTDNLPSCSSYGISNGTPIAVGSASTNDLLATNPQGNGYLNYWCKVGTNCIVDEGGSHEIMMWVSGNNVMCKTSPWQCFASYCGVVDRFYTACTYCVVR